MYQCESFGPEYSTDAESLPSDTADKWHDIEGRTKLGLQVEIKAHESLKCGCLNSIFPEGLYEAHSFL